MSNVIPRTLGALRTTNGPVRRAQLLHRPVTSKLVAFSNVNFPEDIVMNARIFAGLAAAVLLSACSPRQVEVRTAPTQQAQVSLQVNNNLAQGVNVYATFAGADTFLRQVAANSQATIPIQNFAAGTTVSLKAVTIDGVHTYSRNNVTLSGTYVFTLP